MKLTAAVYPVIILIVNAVLFSFIIMKLKYIKTTILEYSNFTIWYDVPI